MRAEVDTCFFLNSKGQMAYRSSGDTCRVNFRQPFAEGVTPIVIVQNVSSQANLPTVTKVFDVTPEGFSFKIMAQVANSTTIREQLCYYIAITPGSAPLADSGYLIHAGLSTEPTGGTASVDHYFIDQKGDTLQLIEPIVIAGGQTHFLDVPSVFRKASDITVKITNDAGEQETRITGMYVRRQVDPTATIPSGMNTASKTGDHIGWIVIDRDPAVNAIHDMDGDRASGFQFGAAATRIFTTDGRLVPAGSVLRPGLYIFTDGRSSRKIMVK